MIVFQSRKYKREKWVDGLLPTMGIDLRSFRRRLSCAHNINVMCLDEPYLMSEKRSNSCDECVQEGFSVPTNPKWPFKIGTLKALKVQSEAEVQFNDRNRLPYSEYWKEDGVKFKKSIVIWNLYRDQKAKVRLEKLKLQKEWDKNAICR